MALNSVAKSAEALNTQAQSAPAVDAATTETKANAAPAMPITAEQANALASALRPNGGLSNPVAEVQAKLRAAMAMEAAAQPSKLQDTAFLTLLIASCAVTMLLGVALGIICVLFGAAMFLFPVSAGSALGGFVIAVGALFYFVYTRGVKPKAAKPADTIEPLAAGRFSAAWGA